MNDFLRNGKRIVFCLSLVVAILFGTRSMGHAQSLATVTDAETLVEVLNAYAPDAAYVSNPGEVTISQFGLPLNGAEIVFSLDEPLRILQNETLLFGANMRLEKGELYFYVNFPDLYTPGWQNCTMTVAPSTRLEIEGFADSFNRIGSSLFDIQGGDVNFHHISFEETVSLFVYGGADVTIENMTTFASFNINEANVTGDINVQDGKIDLYKGTLTFTGGAAYSHYGEGVVNLLGDEAVVNVRDGNFHSFDGGPIAVEKGTLNVSGGYVCASLRGGNFNMSGGEIDLLFVEKECDIRLSGGEFLYSGPIFLPNVPIPDSETLLADGYAFFYENLATNMLYAVGKDLETTPYYKYSSETSSMVEYGTTYAYANWIAPENTPTRETIAYQAAQSADVGPNGKDVKVVSDKMEIYTPKGLAWLAFVTNDTYNIQPGKEYFSDIHNSNIYLKNDLDMTGYGENWPAIKLYNSMFDGEGHRIYNLDIVSPSPSLFNNILTLKNLTVEGDYRMVYSKDNLSGKPYGGSMAGLVNDMQYVNSLIVNCAFIGTLRNDFLEETGSIKAIAGLTCTNYGYIENCYVNPCGEKFICGNDAYIGGLVYSNYGYIENCYSGAEVDFNGSGCEYDPLVYENMDIWDAGIMTNCYTTADVSLDILNENVRAHVPVNAYDPAWKEWSADPDYQCGMPYLFAYGKGTDVANEAIGTDDSRIFTSGGQIIVMTSRPQTVRVIAMSGAVIASERVAGQKAFAGITPGNYIVVVGEKVLKIHL